MFFSRGLVKELRDQKYNIMLCDMGKSFMYWNNIISSVYCYLISEHGVHCATICAKRGETEYL